MEGLFLNHHSFGLLLVNFILELHMSAVEIGVQHFEPILRTVRAALNKLMLLIVGRTFLSDGLRKYTRLESQLLFNFSLPVILLLELLTLQFVKIRVKFVIN